MISSAIGVEAASSLNALMHKSIKSRNKTVYNKGEYLGMMAAIGKCLGSSSMPSFLL
jgi:hypothetical protein